MRTKGTGQAAVEFALVLPIALMILFIVVDFGRAVFAYSTAAQAARDGSRMAMVEQRKVTVDLAAIRGAPTLGLTATNVDVCYKTSGTALRDCNSGGDICSPLEIGCLAIVVVRAPFSPITPVVGNVVGPITLTSTSIQPIEYVCPTASRINCP